MTDIDLLDPLDRILSGLFGNQKGTIGLGDQSDRIVLLDAHFLDPVFG